MRLCVKSHSVRLSGGGRGWLPTLADEARTFPLSAFLAGEEDLCSALCHLWREASPGRASSHFPEHGSWLFTPLSLWLFCWSSFVKAQAGFEVNLVVLNERQGWMKVHNCRKGCCSVKPLLETGGCVHTLRSRSV